MNWIQKLSQSIPELYKELGIAQQMAEYTLEDIPSLKRDIGSVPQYTCPLIDNVVKDIKEVIKIAESGSKYENTQDAFDNIVMQLWDTESLLEAIREHNEQLRNLGKYWYEKYTSMHEEVRNLEQHLQHCLRTCSENNILPDTI